MPRLRPKNDYERAVLANVEKFGWHCTSVSPPVGDHDISCFTYTVGLHHSYGQPEFIIFGLAPRVAHSILGILADAAAAGRMFPLDEPCDALINDYACAFVEVPTHRYYDFVFSALWFNAGSEFPLYQVVWPDEQGYYPWHYSANQAFKLEQPILALSQ